MCVYCNYYSDYKCFLRVQNETLIHRRKGIRNSWCKTWCEIITFLSHLTFSFFLPLEKSSWKREMDDGNKSGGWQNVTSKSIINGQTSGLLSFFLISSTLCKEGKRMNIIKRNYTSCNIFKLSLSRQSSLDLLIASSLRDGENLLLTFAHENFSHFGFIPNNLGRSEDLKPDLTNNSSPSHPLLSVLIYFVSFITFIHSCPFSSILFTFLSNIFIHSFRGLKITPMLHDLCLG